MSLLKRILFNLRYWTWTFNPVTNLRRKVLSFFSKLKSYLPILWTDEDWDWAYFYILMSKKLERMKKDQESWSFSRCTKNVREISICLLLIQRILKESYLEQIIDNPNVLFRRLSEKNVKIQEQQDLDLLHRILAKKSREWWI